MRGTSLIRICAVAGMRREITVRNVFGELRLARRARPTLRRSRGGRPNILAQNGLYSIVLTLQVRF